MSLKIKLCHAIVLIVALGMAFPIGTAFGSTLPNGFTAKVVAYSGQTISGSINATGYDLGVYIGPGINDVKVVGATVTGANDEGILVQDASDIIIKDNIIESNAINPFPYTKPGQEIKAIALAGSRKVLVTNNTVESNEHGGIGVYDDGPDSSFAPIAIDSAPVAGAGNVITGNLVKDNPNDCGIVLTARNPGGGVSNNTISGNNVSGGLGGIVVAGGAFGAVTLTNNVILNNVVTGSLIPGITLHAFGPGVISGTMLIGNVLSNNGVGEVSKQTTGIEIFAIPSVGTITGTQVLRDSVANDYYGVFHVGDTSTHIVSLTATNVTVPVFP